MSEQHGLPPLLEQLVLRECTDAITSGRLSLSSSEPSPPRRGAAPGPASGRRSCGRTPRDRVTVAGRAAAGVRPAPDRDDHSPGRDVRVRQLDLESGVSPGSATIRSIRVPGSGSAESLPTAPAAVSRASSTSVARSDTGRSCRFPRSWSRRRPPRTADRRVDIEPAQGRTKERSVVAEGLLDCADSPRFRRVVSRIDRARHDLEPAQAAGIGDIAPRAAGHQDLDAGPPVFFEEEHACAAFRGTRGGHQSRGPRPGRPHHIRSRAMRHNCHGLSEKNGIEHTSHRIPRFATRSSPCSLRRTRCTVTSKADSTSMRAQRCASHDREVIHRGEVEVFGLELQWQVVVDAVVADLEQEIAGLAAAERSADRL